MESTRNLPLLKDYQSYLRVEKGLRPLTCEAYDNDLKTFAEFIEGRQGVLLTATQQDVANRLAGCLEPGGYLLIGHSESLNSVDHPLRYVQPTIYRKPEASHANSERVRGKR